MGCVNSKKSVARVHSPPSSPKVAPRVGSHSRKCGNRPSRNDAVEQPRAAVGVAVPSSSSTKVHHPGAVVALETREDDPEPKEEKKRSPKKEIRSHNSSKGSSREEGSLNMSIGLPSSYRCAEAEQIAAGWPPWLTSVAGEAIQGWIPLKTKSFEKLDKIGQGTYSSVFRAREVESGKMFALKKVRFDNFQPESVRFMAREITILRRLDHPNIMKLEGIITSRLSNSIYLVFEYMEHDLAGLVSRPDIMFTDAQIKCYMRQLLSGVEHCHVRGIMHRDIKVSNILLNNQGILKIGDFGLANTISPSNKHQLTSRVVTLWYRPPELLMGSTNYGVSVDLWSVGCVFAELFLGKPVLKGRTEVEQLHKIFKLCGSPPDDFWKKSKLPHSTMFKPQTTYESSLRDKCADFPATAIDLLETLLSIDPSKRGTASSALMSEYFNTKPYACNPSSLPKYPPSKEMDAKNREELSRTKTRDKQRDAATSRRQQRRTTKVLREPYDYRKSHSKEETQNNSQSGQREDSRAHITQGRGGGGSMHKEHVNPLIDVMSEASQMVNITDGNGGHSVPTQMQASNSYSWVKRKKQDASSTLSDGSRSKISALDPNFAKDTYDLNKQRLEVLERKYNENQGPDQSSGHEPQKYQGHYSQQEVYGASNTYPTKVSMDFDPAELMNSQGHKEQGGQWNDNGSRRTVRKSRFGRDN